MTPFSFSLIFISIFALAVFTILTGKFLFPFFKRLQVGQMVRDEGPQTHLKKNGTPTFGGLFFCFPILLAILLFILLGYIHLNIGLAFLLSNIALGTVGFTDDYIKIRVNKEGLSFRQKTLIQSLVLIPLVAYLVWGGQALPLFIPFTTTKLFFVEGILSVVYAILLFCYFYFFINAVNYTDGVDGLVSSVSIAVLGVFALCFFTLSQVLFKDFHQLELWQVYSLQKGSGTNMFFSINLIIAFFIGGLLGFLYFNRHPAKVFMGDFGSLALGISLCLFPVYLGVPWLMLLFGLIYFVEALSSLMQMTYFRLTGGKRIFKMAPIHHHFELSGWSENKVVVVFTSVAFISSMVGYLIYLFILKSI